MNLYNIIFLVRYYYSYSCIVHRDDMGNNVCFMSSYMTACMLCMHYLLYWQRTCGSSPPLSRSAGLRELRGRCLGPPPEPPPEPSPRPTAHHAGWDAPSAPVAGAACPAAAASQWPPHREGRPRSCPPPATTQDTLFNTPQITNTIRRRSYALYTVCRLPREVEWKPASSQWSR